ncbi:transposase [Streptomyces spiralis]
MAAFGPGLRHGQVDADARSVAHGVRQCTRRRRACSARSRARTVADVLAWLATTPLAWRNSVEYVAIDMSTGYRAAVRTGLPQHVAVVVDHFHVVQLANKMLSTVRRSITAETRGRRGRASDP